MDPGWPPGLNWLGLALAYHGQGKAEEARKWLAKAIPWIEKVAPPNVPPGTPGAIHLHLHDWLAYHVLRREAESLIGAPQP